MSLSLARSKVPPLSIELAEDKAVAAGAARATINTVEVDDLPLAWVSGNSLRTRVRFVGEIARPP